MTPEKTLADVMTQLRSLGVDPVAVWATGPEDSLRIRVKLRTPADRDRVAGLGNGWVLSLPRPT